jgi:hypothetical protein
MKTTNNLKNKSLKTAAVVVSFVLLSFTVSAQSFWREFLANNSFGAIAEAMSASPAKNYPAVDESKSLPAAWFNMYIDKAMETSLASDDYMFGEPSFNENSLVLESETIKPLKIEKSVVENNSTGKAATGKLYPIAKGN